MLRLPLATTKQKAKQQRANRVVFVVVVIVVVVVVGCTDNRKQKPLPASIWGKMLHRLPLPTKNLTVQCSYCSATHYSA